MLPEAFLSRMRQQLGQEYPAFLESLERPRAVALRFRPGKGAPPELPFVRCRGSRWGATIPPMPGLDCTLSTRPAYIICRRPVPWHR